MNSFSHLNLEFFSFNLFSKSKSAIHPVKLWLSCPLRIHNWIFCFLSQLKLFLSKLSFFFFKRRHDILIKLSCALVELQNKYNVLLFPVCEQFCLELFHLLLRQKTFKNYCLTSFFKHFQDWIARPANVNKCFNFILTPGSRNFQVNSRRTMELLLVLVDGQECTLLHFKILLSKWNHLLADKFGHDHLKFAHIWCRNKWFDLKLPWISAV